MLKRCSVVPFFLAVFAAARVFLQSRTDLAVEILALRQQVAVLKGEVAVGNQKTSIPQRVWEIRVDSVLKLDRAAKRESNDSHVEVPH